jgi:hypothetical protein
MKNKSVFIAFAFVGLVHGMESSALSTLPSRNFSIYTPMDLDSIDRVFIRIYESFINKGPKSEIVITHGDKTETIALMTNEDSNRRDINNVIFKTLNKYFENGYVIENTNTISIGSVGVTTYILEKK